MITYSQCGQDVFVLEQTNFLKNGLFVDIAAADPIFINNTFLLERDYGWDGISIEIDSKYNESWKQRTSTFINQDAFILDYERHFDELLHKHKKSNKHLNYLSLDLEPPELTNRLLHTLPLQKYTFDVITYEHDSYRVGENLKNDAKSYLTSLGYILAKEDNKSNNHAYEDWYILKK